MFERVAHVRHQIRKQKSYPRVLTMAPGGQEQLQGCKQQIMAERSTWDLGRKRKLPLEIRPNGAEPSAPQ